MSNFKKNNYFSYFSYNNYFLFENNVNNEIANFELNRMNTEKIIFSNNSIENVKEWSIDDVYNWIINLKMKRSVLIANAFKEEEIDGEVIIYIEKDDVEDIFKQYNLGIAGLFWLAIFKLK